MANLPRKYWALMKFVVGRKPKDVQANLKAQGVVVKRDAISRCQGNFNAKTFEETPDVKTMMQAHAHYLRQLEDKPAA